MIETQNKEAASEVTYHDHQPRKAKTVWLLASLLFLISVAGGRASGQQPNEYFRAEFKAGKWTLVDPDGQPFFMRGFNYYGDGSGRRASNLQTGSRRILGLRWARHLVALVCISFMTQTNHALNAAEGRAADQFFAREVWPLLSEKCHACHGKDVENIRGGFDLTTSAAALKGGESGEPAIVPGQPESSPLFLSVTRSHADWSAMPPKDNDALTPGQVEALRRWIREGAVWVEGPELARLASAGVAAEGQVRVRTSRALDTAWETRTYAEQDLWAYRPLQRVVPPAVTGNPIDAFLNARLEAESVPPATRADARSLIRRATMDLTGLLPAFEEIEQFEANGSTDAWPALIDRLLDSPQYGAQMARRWLDVVRYADSAGFSNDFDLANAWRYRDYVIRSFNRDTPIDRFVLEQIAGDELPDASGESLLATGFLRIGPWEHLGMAVAAETRQQWLDDVVNSIGNTFLGLEMSCFKCHDHKFDPLPTRDYYAMQAVFATTQPADIKLAFLAEESTTNFDERKAEAEALAEQFSRTKGQKGRFAGFNRTTIQRRVERWAKAYQPVALGVYNGPTRTLDSTALYSYPPADDARGGSLMTLSILRGGSLGAPGDEVRPASLSAVADLNTWTVEAFPEGTNGRRLALANWLVDQRNPLTARVIVNRVWGWHFGHQPLVATPNSFGVKGAKPTHPELLDWLAVWFMDEGWSLKKLHRLIMSSNAYQRAVTPPPGVAAARAAELLAAFPVRRLTAEELRDALLQASGELNLELGGIPARPQMQWDAAQMAVNVQSGIDLPHRPDRTSEQRNKRTVMTRHQRSRRDPLLEVFDQPASERSCELRGESIVVPQVLALINGDFTHDRAIAMADRLMESRNTLRARISGAFGTLLGRVPTDNELQQCESFVLEQVAHHELHPVQRVDVQRLVELASAYDPDYAQTYEPDLQAADVSVETRALADLCLTLFNTSEFLYLP